MSVQCMYIMYTGDVQYTHYMEVIYGFYEKN